jgi:hypothetical protein
VKVAATVTAHAVARDARKVAAAVVAAGKRVRMVVEVVVPEAVVLDRDSVNVLMPTVNRWSATQAMPTQPRPLMVRLWMA